MADNNTEDIDLQNKSKTSQNPEMNRNPEGKGGFGDNPDNINKNGRPPKGWSWAEVLEDIAEEIAPIEVDGQTLTFKQAVGKRLWLECVNGNVSAIKELFNRMEGLPRISVDHSGHIDTRDDKVADLLQLMYGQLHSNNPDDQEDSPDILQE